MRTVLSALAVTLAMTSPIALGLAEAEPADQSSNSSIGLPVGATVTGEATLTTIDGDEVALSSLWAEGPVVITFYRGGWCPFCNKALTEWQGKLDELGAAGATLVALTPEKPENAGETSEKNGLGFTVLSDEQFQAADAFHVRFTIAPDIKTKYEGYGLDLAQSNASGTWELPHPGTFVIDTDGVVRYAWVQEDYRVRADPDEVIAAVRAVTGN